MGMRLAGIEGVVVRNDAQVRDVFQRRALDDKEVAVVLITEKAVSFSRDFIYDSKLKIKRPLILEIPDRHGKGRTEDAISSYVKDAIGLKV
jgi:V/A-type H+-transporting ATPase subunit F